MDYEEHKRKRKEFSKKKRELESKMNKKLLDKHPNLLKGIEDGKITEKEAIKLAKGKMNQVTSVKLKGDGWVDGGENLEIEKKLNPKKISVVNLITNIEKDSQPTFDNFEITEVPIDSIKPHPYNYEIYEPFESEDKDLRNDFIESIKKYGILEPIVVNPTKQIISGHRRWFACKSVGIESVPIRVVEFDNDILAIIHFNKQREKNKSIFKREFDELDKNLYQKLGGRGKTDSINVVQTIAKDFGINKDTAWKWYKVYKENPKLIEEIKLLKVNPMGTISVEKAYNSLPSVIKSKKQKGKTDNDYTVPIKRNLPKVSVDELIDTIQNTYPFSLMSEITLGKYKTISFDESKLNELDKKRSELIKDLDFKKSLTMRELLMYEKFDENEKTNIPTEVRKKALKSLWKPTDINDEKKTIKEIESLEPYLEEPPKDKSFFNAIRIYTSSMQWNPNPGRNLKYLVVDKPTKKILGMIVVGSDIMHIDVRDKKIGWSNSMKVSEKKINHTAITPTLVPTSVLGYNFLGTKLIASLSFTDRIQNDWKERYGDVLVGITTTSLFGTKSTYNGIPNLKKLGRTKGKVILNPSANIYSYWLNWLKENNMEDYNKSMFSDSGGVQTGPKQQLMGKIFDYLGLKKSNYFHLNEKGVYFCELYKNTKDFLCGNIDESKLEKKDISIEKILKWWKPKAIKRYQKLKSEGKLDNEFYWYESMDEQTLRSWLANRGKSLQSMETED